MTTFAKRVGVLSILSWTLLGGGCTHKPQRYTIEVANHTNETIYDALSSFDDGSWKFEFGDIVSGVSKSYLGENMPSPPKSATVTWKNASKVQYERKVNLPLIPDAELEGGELLFAIAAGEKVSVAFRRSPMSTP